MQTDIWALGATVPMLAYLHQPQPDLPLHDQSDILKVCGSAQDGNSRAFKKAMLSALRESGTDLPKKLRKAIK